MNQKTKTRYSQEKGITLIALVITIIVLLILAGVTISMVLGDDGIIKQAQEAKAKYEEKAAEEEQTLFSYSYTISKHRKGTIANKLAVGDFVMCGYTKSDGTDGEIDCVVLYNDAINGLQVVPKASLGTVTIGSDESLEAAIASLENIENTLQEEANRYINKKYALSARCIDSNSNDMTAMSSWDDETSILMSDKIGSDNPTIVPKFITDEESGEWGPYCIHGGFEEEDGKAAEWMDNYYYGGYAVAIDKEGTESDEFYEKTFEFVPVFTLIPDLTILEGEGDGTSGSPYKLDVQDI